MKNIFKVAGVILLVFTAYSCKKERPIPKELDYTGQKGTVNDIEGNSYNTIGIGSQIWMAENLKTTKYNDGTAIPNVTDYRIWAALITGAYCDYSNISANSTTYGRLYNWYVVDNNNATNWGSNGGRNVCPTGWHVPTDDEWTTLTTYLGGESIAGGKLKEIGTTHWLTPNTAATNETGFTALPSAIRENDGAFSFLLEYGSWWSSESSTTAYFAAFHRCMYYNLSTVWRGSIYIKEGMSVRCLKDN